MSNPSVLPYAISPSALSAADPAPITVSDPILSAVAASLDVATDSETSGFLADVVDLINRSPNLLAEIDALDATTLPGGGTAAVELQQGGEGGSSLYHAASIDIMPMSTYDDQTLPYLGGSLAAGQAQELTPAGTFVGILAHEIAHWGDAQLGALYTGDLPGYTIEQAVATEFASEGKAATSQYLAMSQIEASVAADPLPASLANGNVLFNVSGNPAHDTTLLQTVQSLQNQPDAYAAEVSYLGSQFWNVALPGGTYLSTMWSDYSDGGARNDLGINWSAVIGFSITEAEDGTLQGCVIRTSAGSGASAALTYTITTSVPGQQQAQVTDSASGALLAEISTLIPAGSQPMQLTLQSTGFAFTVALGAQASVLGDDDILLLAGQNQLAVAGSGTTVEAAAGAALSGCVVTLTEAGASLAVRGAGASLVLAGNGDSLAASASTVSLGAGLAGALQGGSDAVSLGAGATLTLAGTSDNVTGANATLVLQGSGSLTLTGDGDTLLLAGPPGGGGEDTVTLSGGGERLSADQAVASLSLALSGPAQVSLVAGSASVSGGSAGTTLFAGGASVDYAGGGGLLVLGSGQASVAGGAGGVREIVFGGSGTLTYQGAAEFADVIGGSGSCTISAGSGGGWYGGGTSGDNLLQATGAGTVLQAGGAGDTLVGAAGGDSYLLAAGGNETLTGGNATGTTTAYLGSGSDLFRAGSGGSAVQTGTGTATIMGGGGLDQIAGGSGGADLFVAGQGGLLDISGFRVGVDHLSTNGQAVIATMPSGGGTLFSLSSGASIMLAGVDVSAGSAFV